MLNDSPARRFTAGTLMSVWLLGLHFLPLVHNVGHRPDHSHGPLDADETQAHPHPHPHASPGDDIPEPTRPADHGDSSLLHYAVAVLEERPPVSLTPGGAVAPLPPPAERKPVTHGRIAHLARGPPCS